MRARYLLIATMFLSTFSLCSPAVAGPYADSLAKCLVDSTDESARNELVRWMFAAMSLHPAVTSLSSVSAEQLEDASRTAAGIYMELLTQTCQSEAQDAVKYEGATTIESSFNILGQVAGRELFASPDVAAALERLASYFDKDKLSAALAPAAE